MRDDTYTGYAAFPFGEQWGGPATLAEVRAEQSPLWAWEHLPVYGAPHHSARQYPEPHSINPSDEWG